MFSASSAAPFCVIDEVFIAPFDHVTNPGKFLVESRYWRGQRRRYFTVPYGPYYIWGATARMLRNLAEVVHADAN